MPAGRPPGPPKSRVGLYLPNWLVRRLKAQANQSDFVEDCILEVTGWKKPGQERQEKRKRKQIKRRLADVSSIDDLDSVLAG